MLFLTGSPQ